MVTIRVGKYPDPLEFHRIVSIKGSVCGFCVLRTREAHMTLNELAWRMYPRLYHDAEEAELGYA